MKNAINCNLHLKVLRKATQIKFLYKKNLMKNLRSFSSRMSKAKCKTSKLGKNTKNLKLKWSSR